MVDTHPSLSSGSRATVHRLGRAAFLVFGAGIVATCLTVPFAHDVHAERQSAVGHARQHRLSWNVEVATPTAKPVTAAAANSATPVATQVTSVATPVSTPSLSTLITEVEAAGIQPGSNWTWSVGDTATHCGVIAGTGTGCTYGAAGLEYSIFAGTPTLALVAHELANAEVQNDAVPTLLNEVAAAEGGTSWSPTDAVASCLVAKYMGFQDHAAGTWTCSNSLATTVAENIHDTV
jgi:hypothetical protein